MNYIKLASLGKRFPYLFISVILLSLYYPSFEGYFCGEDFNLILSAKEKFSLFHIFIFDFFGHDLFYRPITNGIFYKIAYTLSALNPIGYRLISFVVFILNNFFIYKITERLTKRSDVAFVASICYLSRCAHLPSIYWIAAFNDIGVTFFVLGCIWLYSCFVEYGNKLCYLSSLIFLILALMSKEIGIILPLLIFLVEIYEQRFKTNRNLKISLLRTFPFFIVALLYTLRLFMPHLIFSGTFYKSSFSLDILFKNLKFYSMNSFNNQFEIIFLSILIFIAFSNVKNIKLSLFSLIWFFIGILPVIFLENHQDIRYLSITLVGFSLLVSCGAKYLFERFYLSRYLVVPVLITIFVTSPYYNNHIGRESSSFFTSKQKTAYNIISYLKNKFPYFPDYSIIYINSNRDLPSNLQKAIELYYNNTISVRLQVQGLLQRGLADTHFGNVISTIPMKELPKKPKPRGPRIKYSQKYFTFSYNQNNNTTTFWSKGEKVTFVEKKSSIKVLPSLVPRSKWLPLPICITVNGTNTDFEQSKTTVDFSTNYKIKSGGKLTTVRQHSSLLNFPPMILTPDKIEQMVLIMPSWLSGIWDESEVVTVTVNGAYDTIKICTDTVSYFFNPSEDQWR